MTTAPAVSVVIPVFNAAHCIAELHRRLVAVLEATATSFEIVLVDDGSTDASWTLVREKALADPRVHAIQLSRNFGQHPAIAAGLRAARGQSIIVMDCDLQDQPEEIPKLQAAAANGGADIVFARRKNRSDTASRQFASRASLAIVDLLSGTRTDPEIGTFSLITRGVADEYLEVADRHAHYLQILRFLGFRQQTVDVVEAPRYAGHSSYTARKLIRHFWNGMVSQSERLLHLSIYLGFLFCALAVVQVGHLIIQKFLFQIGVPGWASLMVVLWLVGGCVLFSLGVLGIYLGKIFEQGQRRPPFIVRSEIADRLEARDARDDRQERERMTSW
ncbi:MAG: glycosyltransferase family 2 protein [Thermoanaerobaculia bacterium]